MMERESYKRILPKVVSIVPDTSIIGMLLTSNVGHIVVKSKFVGLMQHNALMWMVERNRFKRSKQSALGSFISNSQKEWLSNLDDESREMFVNTLFSIFEATGMATFDEMIINRRISTGKIAARIKNLPKGKRVKLMAVIGGLIQSASHVARSHVNDRRKRIRGARYRTGKS